MNLGLVYQIQQKLPQAMAEFRRALTIKPKLTGANFFLGVDLCKSGQGLQAIPYLFRHRLPRTARTFGLGWLPPRKCPANCWPRLQR